MTEVTYDQANMIATGDVMEVMMTGGDGGAMNEDTLAQVVNMLQMDGQLTAGGNHTIIIRQPGSDDIQMIQATSNEGELVVSKATAAEIQALQNTGALTNVSQELLESQQGQVMMVDETGNLVEGVVQLPDGQDVSNGAVHLQNINPSQSINASVNGQIDKSVQEASDILNSLVNVGDANPVMIGDSQQNIITTNPQAPITITTSTNQARNKLITTSNNNVVSIKVNTGVVRKKELRDAVHPDVIRISTVTGQQKYQPPKFHKCEACVINFVSKIAYMNHMECCPNRKKSTSAGKGNITYTCVFCETKFTSRLILMQHVRTCDKAKSTKAHSSSKLKATTSESKLKLASMKRSNVDSVRKSSKKVFDVRSKIEKGNFGSKRGRVFFDPEDDEDDLLNEQDLDSDEDGDERNIVYDDDEDINDEFLGDHDDENLEDSLINRKSKKHMGPIIIKGMYQCRDCNRTFSKEHQYNRHVRACTNAPLISSRIDNDFSASQNGNISGNTEEKSPVFGMKRKKGRQSNFSGSDERSPKKQNVGPKIVSVDPKKFVAASLKGKPMKLYDDDSEEDSDYSLLKNVKLKNHWQKPSKISGASISKIVKISPSDCLIKKSGKALLSKMKQQITLKTLQETPFCGLCGDKFKSHNELGMHTQGCHSEDLLNLRDSLDGKGAISSIKCPLCDLYFAMSHTLTFHMVTFHAKDLKAAQEELDILNLNLVCPYCDAISLSQHLLKEHLATKHLEKLINKPTSSVIPVAIDVNMLLKEKKNGSILPTSKLLTKQEKVLCPDCGLFLLKSYFQHHKCASETYSPSARKFVCSESQCLETTFFKLSHLITHLIQVHERSLPCQTEAFDTMAHFLDWLKDEETQTKRKYTKSLQRMKQGQLTCVWICHRFHNAMKDQSLTSGKKEEPARKTDRHSHCYSRIHTETSFNPSSSRYDGKTLIKYYPEHVHTSDTLAETTGKAPKTTSTSRLVQKSTAQVPSLPTVSSVQSVMAGTEELKQLLEGKNNSNLEKEQNVQEEKSFTDTDEQSSKSTGEPSSKVTEENSSESTEDQSLQNIEKEKPSEDTLEPEMIVDTPTSPFEAPMEAPNPEEMLAPSETIESMGGETVSKDSGNLGNLTDADLLLEKMLDEHMADVEEREEVPQQEHTDSTNKLVKNVENTTEDSVEKSVDMDESMSSLVPTESKISGENVVELIPSEPQIADESMTALNPSESKIFDESMSSLIPSESKISDENMASLVPSESKISDESMSSLVPSESKISDESVAALMPSESKISDESMAALIPSESKISDEDMLEAFGVGNGADDIAECIAPEENSSTSTASNTPQSITSSESQPSTAELPQSLPMPEHMIIREEERDSEMEIEESTYVLPANLDEWKKLFELVRAQVESQSMSEEDIIEAKELLPYQDQIADIPVEKQVEVFSKLCTLANVTVSA